MATQLNEDDYRQTVDAIFAENVVRSTLERMPMHRRTDFLFNAIKSMLNVEHQKRIKTLLQESL